MPGTAWTVRKFHFGLKRTISVRNLYLVEEQLCSFVSRPEQPVGGGLLREGVLSPLDQYHGPCKGKEEVENSSQPAAEPCRAAIELRVDIHGLTCTAMCTEVSQSEGSRSSSCFSRGYGFNSLFFVQITLLAWIRGRQTSHAKGTELAV